MEEKHPNLSSSEKVVNSNGDMRLGIPTGGPLLWRLGDNI